MKIQVATSSGCPVTKLSVLLGGWVGGWVEFVIKYDAHPPSSRSLGGIVVGRPACCSSVLLGFWLFKVANRLSSSGPSSPLHLLALIYEAIGAQPADSRMGGGWVGGWVDE